MRTIGGIPIQVFAQAEVASVAFPEVYAPPGFERTATPHQSRAFP